MENSEEIIYYKSNSIVLSQKEGIYYENEEKILNEDGEEIDKINFEKIIKNIINNIVNKEYDNIVVLAGAGASISSDNNKGKTVAQLYHYIDTKILSHSQSDADFYSFEELKSSGILVDKDIENKNLEGILSKLQKTEEVFKNITTSDIKKDKLSKTIEMIKDCIYDETSSYHFDRKNCKHNILIENLSNKLPNNSRLNIVTTNYDTLFEDAANEMHYWVFDGFSFSRTPVFDPDIFDWQLVKPILNKKTDELEYRKNMINLLKIHGSVDWRRNHDNTLTKIINNDNKDKNAVMIFPSSEKYMESYQEPYFSLMTKFQEMLYKQNTLLISIGFSFADNHIFEMVLQAIKHNNSLSTLITDFELNTNKNDNWKKLETYSNTYDIHFLQGTLNDNLTNYL